MRLMRQIEQDWQKPPAGDYLRLAARGVEFHKIPKPRWESLHPMIGLAELFRITGDNAYRQALVHWWQSIDRTDVHNSGSFSTNEQAVGNPFQPGAIETCCTVAWLALGVEALRLTADSRVADAIEHSTWNAVLGYEHPSGRWCTYDTPMNGKRQASAHSIVFQARPGTPELNCCSVNGPCGLGLISQWAVLGGPRGLYLNYFGPGLIEASLDDGSTWAFRQSTDYPVGGRIDIEVQPRRPTAMALHVRIPQWSKQTRVAVNGAAVERVTPGTYLKIERTWNPGDKISITLDVGVRPLRGDHHVQFNTSLFWGPILLAFDQKYNTMDTADLPELDLAALGIELLAADDPMLKDRRLGPIVAMRARSVDGRRVVLCDFGSAGAYGTAYRSWLPVRNAPPVPFQLLQPEADSRLSPEDLQLVWSAAEPGSRYEVTVWDRSAGQESARRATDIMAAAFEPKWPLLPGTPYLWQVVAHRKGAATASSNGPLAFTIDPRAPSTRRGVVLRAALKGDPAASEGRLLAAEHLEPAPGTATAGPAALCD